MELTHIIAFNLALLAAMASPGPALLLAIRNTLASGRSAGIATGMGLGLMAALWPAQRLATARSTVPAPTWCPSSRPCSSPMPRRFVATT